MSTSEAQFAVARREMLEIIALHVQAVSAHIGKSALAEPVMAALGSIPRHEFVPEPLRQFAYLDQPLPIGSGKTIAQPFIVALMTDLLDLQTDDQVLEVGTGLGYQAAILARLAEQVYSIEIIEELSRDAEYRLGKLDFGNVELRIGDGSSGWSEHAPFDKIIVTAAPELIPIGLLQQLRPGGRMVIPAGLADAQQLMLVEKDQYGSLHTQEILAVRFSPLVLVH
ncbi:MAG: protein-L-isoaspartate(D-aspartate) O-methyltransferase [Gammaproteobacteria bacterium]|nr:protein-L-isoaspartate(D-aspartate) O-methyltransferase [Gammaproteobacteria bacterium]MCP5424285.1 protein-L-isoaspartate(D-aspartate) O-methyltransferase [Gammaproteobacteria bacterium]MCP5459038.1 protein-L-isoaspartate(D-aspartate) O-methyltransferase [Gammaproteobacteria bacterium]